MYCAKHQIKKWGSGACLRCHLIQFKIISKKFVESVEKRSPPPRVGKCKKPECDNDALYNTPGKHIRDFCEGCKEENMVPIYVSGHCLKCSKGSSYGFKKFLRRDYCADHKTDKMVSITTLYATDKDLIKKVAEKKAEKDAILKKKQQGKCTKCKIVTASYGYPAGKREKCAKHKLAGMVSLTNPTRVNKK